MLVFEISDNLVKALWGKGPLQVHGIAVKPLTSDSQEELFKVISSVIYKKKFKIYKPLVLSIPRSQVTLRNLKFPSSDDEELTNIINLQLPRQVPYPREDLVYNYAILEKFPSGFTKILLGIVHKELLRKQLSVFERLNLYPENIQLSTVGLIEFLNKAKIVKKGDIGLKACLDVDANFSDFLIFKKDKILFSKSVAMGYFQLEQPDSLSGFIGKLQEAVRVFLKTEEAREAPSKVYITGAVTEKIELAKKIGRDLQMSVEIIDPFEVVSSLKGLKDLKNIAKTISLSAVLGIAMEPLSERLNFVLPEAKLKKDVRDIAKNLIVTGSIITYLLVMALLGLMGRIYNKEMYLNRLMTETGTLENNNKSSMEALKKINAIQDFTEYKDSFPYYYYELTKILPEDITIDRLIFKKKEEFSLLGKGTDMGEIFKFVRVLNDAKLFGKVELRYSRKGTAGEREFNEFEIICRLK